MTPEGHVLTQAVSGLVGILAGLAFLPLLFTWLDRWFDR